MNKPALAWWFQVDDHLKIVNNLAQKIILSTDGFKKGENTWLSNYLFYKLHLKFLIDAQNPHSFYMTNFKLYFLHLISPLLHESMDRKTLVEQRFKPIAKRSTIYLSAIFKLQKPTSEINEKLNLLNTLILEDTGTICPTFIFLIPLKHFAKRNYFKSYQIILQDNHRLIFAKIRQQTGLTVSKQYCFMEKLVTPYEDFLNI